MPLVREPACCWILLVPRDCTGELLDFHWPVGDPASLAEIDELRWHLFAHDPLGNPPEAWLNDERCLTAVCGGCGAHLGDEDHFADAEHAWKAAAEDGWLGDRCPACQPSTVGYGPGSLSS